jgi:hypothetical protein
VAEYTKRTRKCPRCDKWSEWTGSPTDLCEHCGTILDEEGFIRQLKREEEDEKDKNRFDITLIPIYPDDNKVVVFLKRIIQGFQIAFMAILSFILWLIAMLAG